MKNKKTVYAKLDKHQIGAPVKIGAQLRAPKMIYISCKPTSLARDLKVLREYGYEVERVCCVDMFPGTYHVETVCSLKLTK